MGFTRMAIAMKDPAATDDHRVGRAALATAIEVKAKSNQIESH